MERQSVILGGGMFGAVLARLLTNRLREVVVIEKPGPSHGVNSDTLRIHGILQSGLLFAKTFPYTGDRFHENDLEKVRNVLASRVRLVDLANVPSQATLGVPGVLRTDEPARVDELIRSLKLGDRLDRPQKLEASIAAEIVGKFFRAQGGAFYSIPDTTFAADDVL